MAAGQDKPDFQKTLYDLHGVLNDLNLGDLKKHGKLHHVLVRFQGAFSHEQGRISNQNLTTIGYTPDAELAIRTDIPTSKPQPAAMGTTVHGWMDLPDNNARKEDDEKRKKLHAVNKKMGKDGGRRESSENAMLDLQWKYEQLQKENEDLKERLDKAESQADSRTAMKKKLMGSLDSAGLEQYQAMLQQQMQAQQFQPKGDKGVDYEKMRKENERMAKEIAELKDHLANALSTKISADERNFENINESCRPSVIRGEYTTFCSKQWLRAKKELDATKHALLDEQMKCEILAKILEVASRSAVACVENMFEGLRVSPGETISIDTVSQADSKKNPVAIAMGVDGDRRRLTEDVHVAVTKYLKIYSDQVPTHRWSEMISKHVIEDLPLNDADQKLLQKLLLTREPLSKYMAHACKMTWRMAVQLPSMTLDCSKKTFDPESHELDINSPSPKKTTTVGYYVTPVLMHPPHVMVKGKVMLVLGKK